MLFHKVADFKWSSMDEDAIAVAADMQPVDHLWIRFKYHLIQLVELIVQGASGGSDSYHQIFISITTLLC